MLLSDVHRVAVLDLRILNLDRHAENLLLRRSSDPALAPPPDGRRLSGGAPCFHLVPIDHAYAFPPRAHGAFFEWQHWPQAKEPLSPALLDAIAGLDLDYETALLRSLGLEEPAVRTHYVATMWLKIGAAAGLTPYQLASFAAAPLPDESSLLEQVLNEIAPLEREETAWRSVLLDILRAAARLIANGRQAA